MQVYARISARLTTGKGTPVTYTLIVDAEGRSQSILKYKAFLLFYVVIVF